MHHKLFDLAPVQDRTNKGVKKPHTLPFLRGSPRDMLSTIDTKQNVLGSEILVQLIPYTKLEALNELIPQNNMVTERDIIPGLKGDYLKDLHLDPKAQQTGGKAGLVQTKGVYLHNIRLLGHPKVEVQLENVVKKMYVEQ